MSELWAKLTNLSYELFGVIFPGLVASIFAVLWWAAIGPLMPYWTASTLPQFSIDTLQSGVDSLTLASGISVLVPLIVIWYFAGSILTWTARGGAADEEAEKNWKRRVWLSLTFRIPRPLRSFEQKLQPLFDVVAKDFATEGVSLEWRQFYPVAKTYLLQRLSYSLVTTYQNKYTFHRSITAASASLFWFCFASALVGLINVWNGMPQPNWTYLAVLLTAAFLLVWGFSGSYMFNWKMFGDTIVTESYSLLKGPKNAQPAQE